MQSRICIMKEIHKYKKKERKQLIHIKFSDGSEKYFDTDVKAIDYMILSSDYVAIKNCSLKLLKSEEMKNIPKADINPKMQKSKEVQDQYKRNQKYDEADAVFKILKILKLGYIVKQELKNIYDLA